MMVYIYYEGIQQGIERETEERREKGMLIWTIWSRKGISEEVMVLGSL